MKVSTISASQSLCIAAALGVAGVATLTASAAKIDIIYSKLAGHPTANIPGTLDLGGLPAASDWRAIEDFSVSPDGRKWMVKGRTQLGADLETILILGSGNSGTMYAQEGQPIPGIGGAELYDFFDTPSPVSFDTQGGFVYSFRAKGAPTADDEKVMSVSPAGVQTLLFNQGAALTGLLDVPANITGDEILGNSVGSVAALETVDRVQYVNTPIGNCHSSRYPAMMRGTTAFRQSGVSMIGGEIWDNFILDGAGCTPDGTHWYAEGDTENTNTAIDGIFVVDDAIVFQEGSPVDGVGSPIYVDAFEYEMAASGDWIARGDDPSDNDWAVLNGSLITKTGDPITVGNAELWGAVFSSIACNREGDWIMVGNTNSADPASDTVLVLNGTHIIAREGDPIDLDGNGAFDDDAFIGRGNNTLAAFAAFDLSISDTRNIYITLQLRNSAGQDLNSTPVFGTPDAFAHIAFCPGDVDHDYDVDLTDLSLMLTSFGTCDGDPNYNLLADVNDSGCVDLTDLAILLANFGTNCPAS